MDHIKYPIKLTEMMEKYIDLLTSPPRYFFELLSYFAKAEHEIDRLKHFASFDGQEDLRWYNYKEKRSFLEILVDFPSVDIPLEYLFDFLPPIQPRQFSISSSQLVLFFFFLFFFYYFNLFFFYFVFFFNLSILFFVLI